MSRKTGWLAVVFSMMFGRIVQCFIVNCWLVTVVMQLKGWPANEVNDEVNRMLSDVGLEDKRDARVKTLSGGMKRKLSVGIALVGGSKVRQLLLSILIKIKTRYWR